MIRWVMPERGYLVQVEWAQNVVNDIIKSFDTTVPLPSNPVEHGLKNGLGIATNAVLLELSKDVDDLYIFCTLLAWLIYQINHRYPYNEFHQNWDIVLQAKGNDGLTEIERFMKSILDDFNRVNTQGVPVDEFKVIALAVIDVVFQAEEEKSGQFNKNMLMSYINFPNQAASANV